MPPVAEARIASRTGWVTLVAAVAGLLACSGCSDSAALATYRVTLEGRNYVLRLGDEQRRVGFSATRIVHAPSSEIAVEKAIELVERDKIWDGKIVTEESDRPRLRATQVEEIEPPEVETGPGFDYEFYDHDFFDEDEELGDTL